MDESIRRRYIGDFVAPGVRVHKSQGATWDMVKNSSVPPLPLGNFPCRIVKIVPERTITVEDIKAHDIDRPSGIPRRLASGSQQSANCACYRTSTGRQRTSREFAS